MNTVLHKNAAAGKWFTFSLAEQMGNIGSEVGRAARWQGKDEKLFQGAADRALELFDLTLGDSRWKHQGKLREIGRARELFCSAVLGENAYDTSLEDIEHYLYPFAFAARKDIKIGF